MLVTAIERERGDYDDTHYATYQSIRLMKYNGQRR